MNSPLCKKLENISYFVLIKMMLQNQCIEVSLDKVCLFSKTIQTIRKNKANFPKK